MPVRSLQILVDDLNQKYGTSKWRWVDKDIIYAIAKELNTDTQRVENFYKGIELSNISEMIMAFSGGFVSDLRVKKAIRDVYCQYARRVMLFLLEGEGSQLPVIYSDSLHIRLIAPFYWRVENVMKKKAYGY